MCWKTSIRRLIAVSTAWLMVFSQTAQSAYAGGLLRDAEIESVMREMADPIFVTADIIPPEDVRIFLVDDDSINAFVAGGLNMFIHIGLIKAAPEPEMLYGVIAHETGHIAGAHLSKMRDIMQRATIGSVIGAVIGVGAIAGGARGAGAGVLSGTQNMAMRNMLSDIRVHEESADHAALNYLDSLGISASGMQDMFAVLRRNERGANHDPYLMSHPLSKDRVTTVRNHVMQSSIPSGAVPDKMKSAYPRMRARLIGFTESYDDVLRQFPESDMSFAGRYARAIALYRVNQIDKALSMLDALKKESPNDPFLFDTQGQILFEHGQLARAEAAYQQAHKLLPDSNLIMTDLAKTLIEQNTPAKDAAATGLLVQATTNDKSLAFAWRLLGIAYGKQGKLGESYLALAQESAATGNYKEAKTYLARAKPLLKEGTREAQAANELEQEATRAIKQAEEDKSLF